jgi:beta-N-acetylhexosaminidase
LGIIDTVPQKQRIRAVRRRRLVLAAGALAAFVAGAVIGAGGHDEPPPVKRRGAAPRSAAGRPQPRLTLEQQVGHLVILRFARTRAPGYVRRALREGRAAGVILFRDNVVSPDQVRALTRALHAPVVCLDQEGGDVRILPFAGPELAAPAQAAAGTVRPDSRAAGRDLQAVGVNLTLAPVADVPTVDGAALAGRAFARDPEAAAAAVAASVRGWHEGGVATTVKHFPGLGATTVNTDDGPVTIDRTRAELEGDLAPFRAGIAAGTEFVMASHASYPALDAEHIASQSPAIIDGLLRHELGFDGVVMTDSLEAAAVQAVGDVDEAAVASVQAGVDLILTTGRGSYIRVYRALLARAKADAAFRGRVRESAERVLRAQSSLHG